MRSLTHWAMVMSRGSGRYTDGDPHDQAFVLDGGIDNITRIFRIGIDDNSTCPTTVAVTEELVILTDSAEEADRWVDRVNGTSQLRDVASPLSLVPPHCATVWPPPTTDTTSPTLPP